MAKKQIFIHTRLSRAYLALARLSCTADRDLGSCYPFGWMYWVPNWSLDDWGRTDWNSAAAVFPIRRNYGLGLGLAFRRIGTEPSCSGLELGSTVNVIARRNRHQFSLPSIYRVIVHDWHCNHNNISGNYFGWPDYKHGSSRLIWRKETARCHRCQVLRSSSSGDVLLRLRRNDTIRKNSST